MKKFVLITVGFTQPTPDLMEKWMKWFQSIGNRMVDQKGLMNGREVTPDGVTELPMDLQALTGYLVIEAENIEEVEDIAKACPMITRTLVYEAVSKPGAD